MADSFDVIVIGSGPGGYVAAIRAGQLGLKTAIIEKDKGLGGTCLHRGCIPTKSWLNTAYLYDHVQKAAKFGIITKELSLDFTLVQADKQRIVDKLSKGIEYLMRKNNVQVFKGTGGLDWPNGVTVNGQTLKTKKVVLATGSEPRMLPGLQITPGRMVTSDQLLEIEEVPESIAVLGAGAVGVEFASVFVRLGAKVHLVEMLPRVVPLEDEECSKELERALKKQGIIIYTGHKAGDFKIGDSGVQFTATPENGKAVTINTQMVLVAVGRGPVTNIAGLDKTKVKLERGYVKVGDYLETDEPGIYAIGDIVTNPQGKHPQLAHLASAEGIIVMELIAGKEFRPINYDQIPNCTYCDPEVASVGLTEAEARKRGYDVKVGKFPFSALAKATIEHVGDGFVKYVSDARYDELLGVHIVGPKATELIAEAALGLKLETTTEEVFRTIHAHPTLSEAMAEAAHAVSGHAMHV